MNNGKLQVEFNFVNDTIKIQGVVYSIELFDSLGLNGLPEGNIIKIVKRENDVVYLENLTKEYLELKKLKEEK